MATATTEIYRKFEDAAYAILDIVDGDRNSAAAVMNHAIAQTRATEKHSPYSGFYLVMTEEEIRAYSSK